MNDILEIVSAPDNQLQLVMHTADGPVELSPVVQPLGTASLHVIQEFAATMKADIVIKRDVSRQCVPALVEAGFTETSRDRFTWVNPAN